MDRTLEDTFYILFTTRAFASGVPTTLAGVPVASAYEDGSITQITAGITLGVDHDGVTGLNLLTIVATAANGYGTGQDYNLVITTGTVGGVSVVGEVVGSFSLGLSAANVALATAQTDLDTITGTNGVLIDDTEQAALVDDVWDELVTGHTTNNSTGKILKGISEGWVADEGSVNDVSATTTSFISDLTNATDSFFTDATVVFITGVLKGQSRIVSDYNGTTKTFTFDESFTSAPANTVQFIVLAQHTHTVTSITADIDANSAQLAAIVADTNELQADDVPGLIAALNNLATSDVLTQVNAALDTAIAELGVAAPTATPTLRTGLMLMYMMARNRVDVDTTGVDAMKIYNDAGTQIASKLLTDDGTDYSEAEMT